MIQTKILIVDDEPDVKPMIEQWFRPKILNGRYSFTFAINGLQALELIQLHQDFDVLLLDLNMPEMDGLTLLGKIPDLLPYSKALIVSAYSDMANIRTAMNKGAFDFICKPINLKDLDFTIEKTVQHVHQIREFRQSKELSDLKARFFDNIVHEFRTPLTLILSPVEQLLQAEPNQQQTKDLLSIDRNTRHLLRLINQLLELVKLESGHMHVTNSSGDLSAFVLDLVQAFQPLAHQKGLNITYDTSVTGNWLYDEEKLGQIIYNLIANAIKFTIPEAGVTAFVEGQVSVRLEAGSTLRLTVSDNGIGICPGALPYIFDRFYQAGPPNTRLSTGNGIGLSLVKELIELMNGRLTVNSSPGKGTAFVVELDLVPATEDAAIADKNPSFWDWFPQQEHQSVLLPAKSHPSEVPLILLVDDNEELVAHLAEILNPRYRVITASTAETGWQLTQSELPDIVISDVIMERMDGYSFTHLIKTTPATDHIAVMLLTGKAAYDNRLLGLQHGADDYLTKPFHVEEVLLRLRNLITRQQRLQNLFSQQLNSLELSQPVETLKEGWLKTLYETLEEHIDDPVMNVEWLAGKMAMSRKTLLRKVQALTKLSPIELIRQFRLRKAADLLRIGHSVADVAYMVGFESPAYFSQCFKEIYNIMPSRFLNTQHI